MLYGCPSHSLPLTLNKSPQFVIEPTSCAARANHSQSSKLNTKGRTMINDLIVLEVSHRPEVLIKITLFNIKIHDFSLLSFSFTN